MKDIIELGPNDSTSVLIKKINQNNQLFLAEIKRINGVINQIKPLIHTLKMPDIASSCKDHDGRYYTKEEIDSMLP